MKGEERVGNSREGRKLREGNGVKGREGRKREGGWKGRESKGEGESGRGEAVEKGEGGLDSVYLSLEPPSS